MTESSPSARRVVRFGVFELDLHTGELRKAGVRLSLAAQSFQILALLLERPGDLVTREELRQRLWPNGTFVDFDHGLNAVVNRLRETLGDSADRPRFIETVPRRGYRFVAAVEGPSPAPPVTVESSPHPGAGRGWPPAFVGSARYIKVATVLAALIVLAGTAWLFWREPAVGTPAPRIARSRRWLARRIGRPFLLTVNKSPSGGTARNGTTLMSTSPWSGPETFAA